MITDINSLDQNKTYTYAQYLTWRFAERVELIKGRLFKMSPAPMPAHQVASGELSRQFSNYLHKQKCRVYSAPFDVRFPKVEGKEEQTFTVVQPDISIVCNPTQIDKKGCIGAPDLIVEIISPSTAQRDVKYKYELYEENGVSEYWIVYPDLNFVEVFILSSNGKYQLAGKFLRHESIQVSIFNDLEIVLEDVFEDEEQTPDDVNEIRL